MYIGVDFDGTIVDHIFPDIGEPVPGAIEWLAKFIEMGAEIILFTMRSDGQDSGPVLTNAVDFLLANKIELFGINTNPTQHTWTASPKAYANVYIDDAAIGCPLIQLPDFNKPCVDWAKVGPIVQKMLFEEVQLGE